MIFCKSLEDYWEVVLRGLGSKVARKIRSRPGNQFSGRHTFFFIRQIPSSNVS